MRETQPPVCPNISALALAALRRVSCDTNSLVDNDAKGMHIGSAAHNEQISRARKTHPPVCPIQSVWVTHPPVRPLQLAPVPAAPDKIHSVSDLKKVEDIG